MEEAEIPRLAKELADELVLVAVRFGTGRVSGCDSESFRKVLFTGALQAAASLMVSLEDAKTDEQGGRLRAVGNRIRLEGYTEQEIDEFNAKTTAAVVAMFKAVYE